MSNPTSTTRRNFLRYASLAASAGPFLGEAPFARAAQQQQSIYTFGVNGPLPPDTVLINANENPLGPSKSACEAIGSISHAGGRYDIYGEQDKLTKTFATQNGLKENQIAVYAGSTEPLHYTVLAFASPTHGLVTADPSYESPMMAAQLVSKAPISR